MNNDETGMPLIGAFALIMSIGVAFGGMWFNIAIAVVLFVVVCKAVSWVLTVVRGRGSVSDDNVTGVVPLPTTTDVPVVGTYDRALATGLDRSGEVG